MIIIFLEELDVQDSTLSHAIYVGKRSNNKSEVVLFTGRRWVMTNIFANTTLANITELFYGHAGRRRLAQRIVYEKFQARHQVGSWVSLISEEVISVKDQGTPVGLRWFLPRYEDSNQSGFPGADLARPNDSVFTCALCDNIANLCAFGGTCNENGACTCANGAYGNLCRRKPLGDGECHPYFNTAEHSYDGGDCCASTCNGKSCGRISSSNPFEIDDIQYLDPNSDYQGRLDNHSIVTFDDSKITYDCKDPEMAAFMIEMSDMKVFGDDVVGEELMRVFTCAFGSISVRCDEKLYFETPSLYFQNKSDCSQSYKEPVYVPYGAKCNLIIELEYEYEIALYFGEDTNSTPIKNRTGYEGYEAEIAWRVPSSKCLTETLSNEAVSMFDESSPHVQAIQELSEDLVATSMCRNNDRDLLRERYFLSLLNQSVAIKSPSLSLHQCEKGWGNPTLEIICDKQERITSLIFKATGNFFKCNSRENSCTLPSEIGFLSHLSEYDHNLHHSIASATKISNDCPFFQRDLGFIRLVSLVHYLASWAIWKC